MLDVPVESQAASSTLDVNPPVESVGLQADVDDDAIWQAELAELERLVDSDMEVPPLPSLPECDTGGGCSEDSVKVEKQFDVDLDSDIELPPLPPVPECFSVDEFFEHSSMESENGDLFEDTMKF